MNQGLIPRRYAKALFEFASEKGVDEGLYESMRRLIGAFQVEPALQKAVSNPYVSAADKQNLILAAAAAQGKSLEALVDLTKLLERNHRIEFMQGIALAYNAIYREAKKIYSVVITAAAPLQAEELQRIRALVEKHLPEHSTAEFLELHNPDLIGGFTVCIDNELLDASVANELKQLRIKLLSH